MAWKSFLRHIIGSLGKQGYIEKQDVERKWKLEMETQPLSSLIPSDVLYYGCFEQ